MYKRRKDICSCLARRLFPSQRACQGCLREGEMPSFGMDEMAGMTGDVSWAELETRQQNSGSTAAALAELSTFNNMSSRQYDKYVFSLDYKTTGCYQRGALPIPLNANGTCLPGWHCKLHEFGLLSASKQTNYFVNRSKLRLLQPSTILPAYPRVSSLPNQQRNMRTSRSLRAENLCQWLLLSW